MSMKKIVRLTESDLHRIVKESVRRVIDEAVVVDMMGRRENEDMTEHIKKVYTDENGKPMFNELTRDVTDCKLDQYITDQKFCKDMSVWMVQNRDYLNLRRFNESVKWRREQLKIKDPDKRETKMDLFLKILKQEAEKIKRDDY